MMYTDYAIKRIKTYLKQKGVAKIRLAASAGIPESSLRNVGSNKWNPTSETLKKLEGALPDDFGLLHELPKDGTRQ